MRIACLLIDHLPVKTEVARDPRLDGRPVIVVRSGGSPKQAMVLDASPQAAEVSSGMPLQEALSLSPHAVLVEPDPVAYRTTFDAVLDAVEGIGADVEEAGLGHAYVRLDGLDLLFGGTDTVATALLRVVPEHLTPRIGIGPGRFVAEAAAHQANEGALREAPDDVAAFLAPLRVELLPVRWEIVSRLRGFGIHSLGQVAELGVGSLQAQFGRDGTRLMDLVRGIDRQPFVSRVQQEAVTAAIAFVNPMSTIEAIATAADSLLGRVFALPAMKGRFARVCLLEGAVFRAPAWSKRMVFREPIGSRGQAYPLLRHTLEGHPPSGPLEDLRLTLSGLTGEAGRQESLFADVRRQQNLEEALRQLRERLGTLPPLFHVREVEPWSRLPERRQALVPYAP